MADEQPQSRSPYIQAAPLASTAAALRAGHLDLSVFIDAVCDRVDAVEPALQALMPEPDRRARLQREAAALAARYPDPDHRPPLYGVPVGIKDIFRVDGLPTTGGSRLPPEVFAGPEATVVTMLRAAGALILGKTVTAEFAFFEPGPTRNPHNLEHTPGGSSSGSAAATAAGLCLLAIGTQTVGSIIRPAAFCGIVGFKPTFDRVPTPGLLYCSPALDHVGLFTQDVGGMALAASIVCDDWQPVTPERPPVLGVPDGPYLDQATPEALNAFEVQITRLQAAGLEVRRVSAMSDIAAIALRHTRLVRGEMAQSHAAWFGSYESLYRPQTAAAIHEGQGVSVDELDAARAGRAHLRTELQTLMDAAGIDLWLSPAAPGPAPAGITATGNPAMNLPWTHAGLPTITLPAGFAANGLPLGLQIAAPWMADELLLAWAEHLAPLVD